MGFFDHDESEQQYAYQQVHHEGSMAHEAIAGAAAFAAMRAYEQHQAANGQPPRCANSFSA